VLDTKVIGHMLLGLLGLEFINFCIYVFL